MYTNDDTWAVYLFLAIFFVGILSAAVQPYFEAQAFNDCTGGNASYLTALFTELRVTECKNN